MKRFIIAALVALPLSLAFSVSAEEVMDAQADVEPELPGLVITATRSEQPQNRLPAGVTVITREEIEDSHAQHVVEVLRNRGAVQVTDLFGDGSSTLVGVRGFGENAHSNTLILVDGRRLSNPDIASAALNDIALKDVERIEIIEGSAGALYGDQAVGGVINIITRQPQAFAANLEATAGSYDAGRLIASVADRLDGGFSYRLSGEKRVTDNYRDHNDLDYENLLGRADYGYASGSVFAEVVLVNDDLETPGALFANEVSQDRRQSTANYRKDFSNNDTTAGRVGLRQSITEHWRFEGEVTQRDNDGVFRLSSVFGPEPGNATQDRSITAFNPRFVGSYHNGVGPMLFTLGADAQDAGYKLVSRFGPQRNDQELRDVYAQGVVPLLSSVDLTLGVRHSKVDNKLKDGGAFAIYPGGKKVDDAKTPKEAGLAWRPDESWRLFLRYDENLRFAKVDEFFASGAAPGTVNLKTQTGDSKELGAEWQRDEWRLKGLLYRLDLDDEIAFNPVTFANVNLDATRRDGVLLEAAWQALEALELSASYGYVDAQVRSGSFKGKDVPLVAKQVGRVVADWRIVPGWNLFVEASGVDARRFSGDFDNSLDKLAGFGVVNAGLGYRAGRWILGARANNLGGKKYSEFGSSSLDPVTFAEKPSFFPSPETNGVLTVGYQF